MPDAPPPLEDVFAEYGVTPQDVMEALNVTDEAVRMWRRGSRRISVEFARIIEQRFLIPKHLLRPDLWEPPPKRRQRASA